MLQLDRQRSRDAGRWTAERRWALLRLVLAFLQVCGASLGFSLLLQTGVTRLGLIVVTATGLCATLSVALFGGRRRRS